MQIQTFTDADRNVLLYMIALLNSTNCQSVHYKYLKYDTTVLFLSSYRQLFVSDPHCKCHASKLIEEHFLDLRNMFSNQENIGIFFSKQEK